MLAFWILLGLLALFAGVLLLRAALFRPLDAQQDAPPPGPVRCPQAVEHLARMVQIPTVSHRELEQIDEAQFERFRALLPELYPLVTKHCPRAQFGRAGLLYHWKGKSSEKPTVLMAHYDVVPSDGAGWTHPPFSGFLDENGVLWGRGTLDTKGTLCGILEAVELLLARGFVPENDVYLSFGGDEEVMGPSAPALVAELKRRGVKPALVLDEGGAIVEGAFPGVKEKTAVVGVCEKGQMFLELICKSGAGHTSAPPPKTAVGSLCAAAARVAAQPSPAKLTAPAAALFDTLGRHSSFGLRLVFANLWCFWPVLKRICEKAGGEMNAMVRTTCSFTRMEGSSAYNVFPAQAGLGADVRVLNGETQDQAVERIRRVMADPDIEIRRISGCEPSPVSPAHGEAWDRVRTSILEAWPGVVVSPYMMVARSDSSSYCSISGAVYRFSAMELSAQERRKIHGIDECIPAEKLEKAVEFFVRVLEKS